MQCQYHIQVELLFNGRVPVSGVEAVLEELEEDELDCEGGSKSVASTKSDSKTPKYFTERQMGLHSVTHQMQCNKGAVEYLPPRSK